MIFLPYLSLKTTLEDYSFKAMEYLIKRRLHKTAHISQRKHKTRPVPGNMHCLGAARPVFLLAGEKGRIDGQSCSQCGREVHLRKPVVNHFYKVKHPLATQNVHLPSTCSLPCENSCYSLGFCTSVFLKARSPILKTQMQKPQPSR